MNIGEAKINNILVGVTNAGTFIIKVTDISIFKPQGRIRGDILYALPNKYHSKSSVNPLKYRGRTFVFAPLKVRIPTKEERSFLE